MINFLKKNNKDMPQWQANYIKNKKLQKIKYKTLGLKNNTGRNNTGKITVRRKGGGHKQCYRVLDSKREFLAEGVVTSIEYDPNRNAHIASIFDTESTKFFYTLAPNGLNVGDIIKTGKKLEAKLGYSMPLKDIPTGCNIYNISKLKKMGIYTKAAGTQSIILEKFNNYVKIKLNSGKIIQLSEQCYASIGSVSNELEVFKTKKKAGNSRWLNRRPSVRGVAMNPVDHPNGGGEGKKSGFKKSLWGKVTKSKK